MSKIDKLSIRGIRSFSPESAEILDFFTPLTVIVGHNGSGKTTIIECLKYATTGDLPPNSKGGAFIHDPKVAHETEVKAQIKLKLKAVNGKEVVCQRALKLTQKKTKTEMKTLEGLIHVKDIEKDEQNTIGMKCAQLDLEIPILLGVSRAILENVIFCHQEDSCWPLSEPSILKKKFDEIFESTKYAKVLDVLKVLKKKNLIQVKLEQQELQHLQQERTKCEKLKNQLENNKSKISELQEKASILDKDINEIIDDTEVIVKEYQQVQLFENTIQLLEKELELLNNQKNNLSKSQLLLNYTDLESQLSLKENELLEFNSRREKTLFLRREMESRISVLTDGLNQKTFYLKQFQTKKEEHESKIRRRNELAKSILHGNNESSIVSQESEDEFNYVLIDQEISRILLEIDRIKNEWNVKTNAEYNNKIITLSTSIKRQEDEIASRKKQKYELAQKLQAAVSRCRSLADQVQNQEVSSDAIQKLQSELQKAKDDLSKIDFQKERLEFESKTSNIESLKSSLKRKVEHKMKAREINLRHQIWIQELEKIGNEIKAKETSILKELQDNNLYCKETSNEDSLVFIKRTEKESISKRNELQQKINGIDDQIKDIESNIKFKADIVKDLQQKRKEAQDYLKSTYGSSSIDLKAKIKDAEDKILALENKKLLDNLYEKSMQEGHCFLCKQSLSSREPHQQTSGVEELDSIKAAKKKMDNDFIKYILPFIDGPKNDEQVSQELENLRHKKKELEEERQDLDLEMINIVMNLESLEAALKIYKEVDGLKKDYEKKSIQVRTLEAELSNDENSPESSDFNSNKSETIEELNIKLDSLSYDLEKLRKTWEERLSNYNSLKNDVLIRQNKLQDAEMKSLKYKQLSDELKAAEMEKEECQKKQSATVNEKELNDAIAVKQNELRNLEKEFNEKFQTYDSELNLKQNSLNELYALKQKITEMSKEIESNSEELSKINFKKIKEEIDSLKTEIETQKEALSNYEKKVDPSEAIKDLLTEINAIKNTINFKSIEKEIEAKEHEMKKLKFGNFKKWKEISEYKKAIQDLKEVQTEKTGDRARVEGELRQLRMHQEQMKSDFDSDYVDIESKFKDQLIKVTTLEMAIKDLEKYRLALDAAITRYHSMQMENLNRIIRELWTKVYKGNDVDSVEIRSEAETTTATGSSKGRNYRVVMIKGNTEIDMRGRSSAGQRVLTSIIIRLALAETFCLQCGILALDEPTTNLDQANINSLADALVDIIKERRKQDNFQLIVITHDESFLQRIGEFTSYYFRVSKDHNQHSKIEKVSISEVV